MCTSNWRISLSGKILGRLGSANNKLTTVILLHIHVGWRLSSSISRSGWIMLILDHSHLLFIDKHK